MRGQPTAAEATLWESLRNRKLDGYRFRRQHTLGRFIVDFYCAEAKLVVEVDGPIHDIRAEQDGDGDAFLESRGLLVMRLTNEQVEKDLASVLAEIAVALAGEGQ